MTLYSVRVGRTIGQRATKITKSGESDCVEERMGVAARDLTTPWETYCFGVCWTLAVVAASTARHAATVSVFLT